MKAFATTLALESEHSAEMRLDWYFHHGFGVSDFTKPTFKAELRYGSVTAVSMVRLIIIARYHGSDVTCEY